MSFEFVEKVMCIGGEGNPSLQFYKRGFKLGGSGSPSWQDIVLSGNGSLTLTQAKADGLNYLKLFGGTEQRNLPNGYTQVEYLESSGKQYIDTGIKANTTTTTYHTGVTFVDVDSSYCIFGSRNEPQSVTNSSCNVFVISGQLRCDWTYGRPIFLKQLVQNEYYDIKCSRPKFILNDIEYESGNTVSINQNNNFLIGNMSNSDSGAFTTGHKGKIYFSKLYNNDVLVFDGIPCRRNSDNVLGMYDTVTGNFFTNQGTGTFTAGSDVVPSPDTPMDIVCNNGVIKWDSVNQKIYTDGTTETVEIDTTGGTATAEMLLSVGNYQDVQSVLDGSVTRNVGVKVLDGSEDWIKASAGGTQRFYMTLTDSAMITVRYNVQITHFHFNSSLNDVGVGFLANQILCLYANPDWTVDQFKQWLADQYANGTPVIIVYPLAEPTTETVTPQPLSIQAGTNIITAEGSIDNLPLEVSYKAGVAVTITEVQNAQLDNNVEVTING